MVCGLAVIPLLVLVLEPDVETVGVNQYRAAPRDMRLRWSYDLSSQDRDDERVIIGTSIVAAGFDTSKGSASARFSVNLLNVDEATTIASNLLSRPRPPKTILVDWAALNDIPAPHRETIRTPYWYSLENLEFAMKFKSLSLAGKSEKTRFWRDTPKGREFREENKDRVVKYVGRFREYSRFPEFVQSIEPLCKNSDTNLVVVRFPVFLSGTRDHVLEAMKLISTEDHRALLASSECDLAFVDLLSESVNRPGGPEPYFFDTHYWTNFNHFKPRLGDIILDDPRLGGEGLRAKTNGET